MNQPTDDPSAGDSASPETEAGAGPTTPLVQQESPETRRAALAAIYASPSPGSRPDPVSSPTPDLDIFGRPAPAGRDWSHRRGEPRIFAFFWTLYLLLATIAAFWSVGAPGAPDPMALRPAARAVLAAITVGVALLWPMTRLSQEPPSVRPGRIMRAVGQDLIVLLVPAQAIIWPQLAMAAWPLPVVAALACSLTAWALLIGSLLAMAQMLAGARRGWWMLAFVAIAGLGPLVALGPGGMGHADRSFDWWWMTSPITTGFELSRDRPWTGAAAAVADGHWRAIAFVGALAAFGWLWAAILASFRRVGSK